MDACEPVQGLRKLTAPESPRRPLLPTEKNNAATFRRPRTREVSSRYRSHSPSVPSSPQRCSSPNLPRTMPASSQLVLKRAVSAERKRPSTPPSPQRASAHICDSSLDTQLPSRRTVVGRSKDNLWPSTMRSLSVSFQSDSISIPTSKKEKPASTIPDRTLRPSSNVAHKQVDTTAVTRKPSPERKRSPLKGKNLPNQLENSKPVDSSQTRLMDQHRWPSRTGGKLYSSNAPSRSVDIADKTVRTFSTPLIEIGLPSLRRASSDAISKPFEKNASEVTKLLSLDEISKVGPEANIIEASRALKPVSTSLADRTMLRASSVRSQSLPSPRSRPASPSKASVSVVTRGASPSRARPSTPPRAMSPSRIRQSNSSTSVLSFVADLKMGKKESSCMEDAHQLRFLYNRYLQWRFANAQAESVHHIQQEIAERTLYDVWKTTVTLRDSVMRKRINIQQQKLELKLISVLNDQMVYLNGWAAIERDHIYSVSGAVKDLEASTLQIPVTGRAKADVESLKSAISSAVDVMKAMGSSIRPSLSRVEEMSNLVSELSVVAAKEKTMIDQCGALLDLTAAKRIEEYSFRANLIQMQQARGKKS